MSAKRTNKVKKNSKTSVLKHTVSKKKNTAKKVLKSKEKKRKKEPAKSGSHLNTKHPKKNSTASSRKEIFKKSSSKEKNRNKNTNPRPEISEPIVEPTIEQIWELLLKGRNRGFVTEIELGRVLSHPEAYIDLYEGLLDLFDKHGVSVVEPATQLLGNNKANGVVLKQFQGAQPDMDVPFDLGQISSDSIQMYLREIGKIPLLKTE
jgi:RNA polymerase primary sigma factor